jgi:hypothetical protein
VPKLRRPFYITIALQLALFGAGVFLLIYHDLQLVWCLPAIVLWLYFAVLVYSFTRLRKDNHRRCEILTNAFALGGSAVAFTVLGGFGVARHWAALFYIEFFALELLYSWNIIILGRKWKTAGDDLDGPNRVRFTKPTPGEDTCRSVHLQRKGSEGSEMVSVLDLKHSP